VSASSILFDAPGPRARARHRLLTVVGAFLVLGLLAWLYLGGQVTLLAAEVNVVRARRLWPRSFFAHPLLEADKRALTSTAEVEERVEEQNVEVDFDGPTETETAVADGPSGAVA